jgi:hypothetical protein
MTSRSPCPKLHSDQRSFLLDLGPEHSPIFRPVRIAMEMKNTSKSTLSLAAAVAAAFTLAPTAQADTVVLTSSTQLNLAGRDVLAAVNFYDADRRVPIVYHVPVGSIQGTSFSNFDLGATQPFSVAEGTLSMTAPSGNEGREFNQAAFPGAILTGTFGGPAADATQAEFLAGAGWFTISDIPMTFDFGAEWANTDVEVQLLAGGVWNKGPTHRGELTASVGGDVKGSIVELGTADLLTFQTTTDANGDLLIDWDFSGGTLASRDIMFMGAIVTVVPDPTSFPLTITNNGVNLVFEWESQPGMFYVLWASTDLEADFSTWDSVNVPGSVENNGVFEIAHTAPLNMHTIERPMDDSTRFYRVQEFPLPPVTVFLETFDGIDPGWTTGFDASDTLMNTAWQMGDPAGAPATGPTAANSAPNCYGTNLTTNYGISSNTWLRSPAIDLTTATGATVTFQQWLDMDEFDNMDRGTLRVLDASGLPGTVTELGVVQADITGFLNGWAEFSADLPAAALGQSIVLEFGFVSDGDDIFDASGWYFDDVVLTTPAP